MARPFRLQTVVRLREARRDAVRAQLADALRAVEVLREKKDKLAADFEGLLEQRRNAVATSDAGWLLNAGRYELVLRADEKSLQKNIEAIEVEVDRRRQAVAEAEREVRALELLRERAEQEEREANNRREARQLDEHGSRQAYAANKNPTPLT